MSRSPGHRKWPDHKVQEERLERPVTIEAKGDVVAASQDVIQVEEDEHPRRYYFPRSDVAMERFEPSEREAECPFKGHGRYFHLRAGDETIENAAWSYEDVYDEHSDLKDRIAFHDEELSEVRVRT